MPNAFQAGVAHLTSNYLQNWNGTSVEFPHFERRFSPREKEENERRLDRLLREMPDSFEAHDQMSESARTRARAKARIVLAKALIPSNDGQTGRYFEDCESVAEIFVQRAKENDPGIQSGDVHQALRNLWVFNSIQAYFDSPVSLTRSSFAYSLLYPYTDNLLDGADRAEGEPAKFLRWLTERLEGGPANVFDGRRVILSRLIGMIEQEFPRQEFPDVYRSLLSIHSAQQESLRLHREAGDVNEEVLLSLSVAKGGTSVLADGFLVSGRLGEEHRDALFGYGVLLQLVDDLQDLGEDLAAGHSTPFSRAARGSVLPAMTNRLFRFTRSVVAHMSETSPNRDWNLPRVIQGSCDALAMEAIALHSTYYPAGYLTEIEQFLPQRLSYLATIRQRFHDRYVSAARQHTPPG